MKDDKTPSVEEMLTELDKWWEQRRLQIDPPYSQLNLLNQHDLINIVVGITEDISFLLRLNKQILKTISHNSK